MAATKWAYQVLTLSGFVGLGVWAYAASGEARLNLLNVVLQSKVSGSPSFYSSAAAWTHLSAVYSGVDPQIKLRESAAGVLYWDDVYAVSLPAVSLTVTPASETNSVESGGIRVDGRDTLVQPVSGRLKANSGRIVWRTRPRHAPADVVKFGGSVTILKTNSVSGQRIDVYANTANQIVINFIDVAGSQWFTGDVTGLWAADESLLCELGYRGAQGWLKVNGVSVITLSGLGGFGANVPTTMYWGTTDISTKQFDAVFLAP